MFWFLVYAVRYFFYKRTCWVTISEKTEKKYKASLSFSSLFLSFLSLRVSVGLSPPPPALSHFHPLSLHSLLHLALFALLRYCASMKQLPALTKKLMPLFRSPSNRSLSAVLFLPLRIALTQFWTLTAFLWWRRVLWQNWHPQVISCRTHSPCSIS